ncbi:hypothetical protein [Humibacter ginsenosidimutans]|uniref:Uncharacterized protein n=1 Tax=Humibacter ginsenosidimutans TaxID=2599293 RepID=A0A5B8M1E7_9MICO|nr:hypothetical protein [Humibacter ginsenosidimutans]QDZ13754.1 hypothetical protein FPZ11_02160 [Humibacter ginsenosidimutans]
MPIAALITLAVALAYFIVTTTADLYPFNNTREATAEEKRAELLVNVPILAAPIVLLVLGWTLSLPVLAVIGGAIELIAAIGGLLLWWMPYLAGVTMPWATAGAGLTWDDLHQRTYAHTVIVLPRIGDRPRPNLEHMILHALFIVAGVLTIIAATTL